MKAATLYWLFLIAASLMAVLVPQAAVAQDEKIDLTLTLVPSDYYNQVKGGEDNRLFLEVRNAGNKAVTKIGLSAEAPQGWTVEFKPASIDYLGPGSVQTVDLNIKPDRAASGDHRVNIIAQANEIRKVISVMLGVTAASNSPWLWIGAILGVIVVIIFGIVFVRLNRQK